jgi:CTP:molybdopterin cytidylyltransferase MocA
MRVVAILLAAGEGRRIGGPKALLSAGGESFLARACAGFDRPGVDGIVAVLGHEGPRVAANAAVPSTVRLVQNPRYREGMLTSVLAGLDAAEVLGAGAVLLHPVDHPLVDGGTIDAVASALRGGAVVAVPVHRGRRGHPGGFARGSWPALRTAAPDRGARAVLAEHPDWVVEVPADPRCLEGVDTPQDYARLFGTPPVWQGFSP